MKKEKQNPTSVTIDSKLFDQMVKVLFNVWGPAASEQVGTDEDITECVPIEDLIPLYKDLAKVNAHAKNALKEIMNDLQDQIDIAKEDGEEPDEYVVEILAALKKKSSSRKKTTKDNDSFMDASPLTLAIGISAKNH